MTRWRHGQWAIWLTPEFGRETIIAALDCFDNRNSVTPRPAEWWPIHAGGRSTIYGASLQGKTFCLKVFTDQRCHVKLRNLFGWSKGRRAFCNGLRACNMKVPVPTVYAYAERRPFGPTLVVMELLEGAVQLNLLLEQRLANGIDLCADPVFLDLSKRFATFTWDLHAKGVRHRDYSPRNVLVDDLGGQNRLQLIDLEDLDFAGNPRKFRSDIEHFHVKLSRYVDPSALTIFRQSFSENYGKDLH